MPPSTPFCSSVRAATLKAGPHPVNQCTGMEYKTWIQGNNLKNLSSWPRPRVSLKHRSCSLFQTKTKTNRMLHLEIHPHPSWPYSIKALFRFYLGDSSNVMNNRFVHTHTHTASWCGNVGAGRQRTVKVKLELDIRNLSQKSGICPQVCRESGSISCVISTCIHIVITAVLLFFPVDSFTYLFPQLLSFCLSLSLSLSLW